MGMEVLFESKVFGVCVFLIITMISKILMDSINPLNLLTYSLVGGKIAEHASRHLHNYILNCPEYKENKIAEAMKKVNI